MVDAVNRAASWACHALLGVIVGVTVLQVFLRFVLDSPLSWSEEVALLALIWFGFLAVAVGVRRHEHLAITALRDRLPPRGAVALDYAAQGGVAAFLFTVAFNGEALLALTGAQLLPATGWPKLWLYLPPVVGGTLGGLNAVANALLRDVAPAAEDGGLEEGVVDAV